MFFIKNQDENFPDRFVIQLIWHKSNKKWSAFISFNGKQKRLGFYDNEVEAACDYDNAAREYHGEFAVLNFKK
jgi:hypothetical protein